MTCPRCHRDVSPDAAFCPACGASQSDTSSGTTSRLVRVPSEQRVAGVCAGLADYLDVDVTLMRALWLALSIVPGAIVGGLLAYALAWMVMPVGQASRPSAAKRLTRSTSDSKMAGVCGGVAQYFAVDSTLVRVLCIVLAVMPGAVIGGVFVYLSAWLIMPRDVPTLGHQQPQAA